MQPFDLRNDMSRQSVLFTCLLFMMAASVAASAQEIPAINESVVNGAVSLNNTTMNATSNATLNDTAIAPPLEATLAANETMPPAANETQPAEDGVASDLNESLSAENETASAENLAMQEIAAPAASLGGSDAVASVRALGGANRIASSQSAFAIGGGASTPNLFSIGGRYMLKEAYDAGLPAETIMDLSTMPFYINKI